MVQRGEPDLQLGWTGASVVAWSWDGRQVHPARSSGGLYGSVIREWGWVPPGSWAGSVVVDAPGGRLRFPGLIVPPAAVLDIVSVRRERRLTATSRWMRSMVRLARRTAGAGHLRPVVLPGATTDAELSVRWRPVESAALGQSLAAHAKVMPPAVRVALAPDAVTVPVDPAELTSALHAWLVDLAARQALRADGWSARDLVGVRSPDASAVRAVASAWASTVGDGATLRPRSERAGATIAQLAHHLDRMYAAATGAPLVSARLRLGLPAEQDDPEAPWPVELELADRDDPGRWCLASDVWGSTPLAVELAGRAEHLGVLADAIRDARDVLVADPELSPVFAPLREHVAPTSIELDLHGAATLLANVGVLDSLSIPLLAPGQLAPSTTRVSGSARPAATSDGRFGRGALVDWTLVVDDREIDPAVIERAATTGAALLHVDGRWVRIDVAAARRALDALRVHEREHAQVDAVTLLRLASTALDGGPGDPLTVEGTGWVDDLLAGLPDDRLIEGAEPAGFHGPLRHYQRRGLGWLQFLDRLGLGGCLADDMGLGKTPTTLAHLQARPGPHLVLCPLSVVRNWQSEAARFTPGLRCVVHHGADRPRGDEFAAAVAAADVVVTTYGLAIRDRSELTGIEWRTVVLDEAQAIKNPRTHAARLVRALRADQKVALTGTPVENRLGELWAILDAVNPGLLGPEQRFQQRWATPIERDGDAEAAARLRQLTSPFVLRRTKADRSLVPDLPDKVEQIAWATLTREQAAMYQAVVDQLLADADAATGMKRRGLVLAALTRLKQICNHPAHAAGDGSRLHGRSGKLARFDELVADLLDAGERALVFTQYREMGQLLQQHLAGHLGLDAPFLHGGVAKARRDRMVDHFQAGEGSPLLLVSLKAGGTGLNLTAATRVVHYDRWWNPAVEDQATDRAWRIGQQRAVFVHKLVCQGTVEERIAELIDDKRRIAGMVVGTGAGEAWLSELTTAQLRDLVALDHGATER